MGALARQRLVGTPHVESSIGLIFNEESIGAKIEAFFEKKRVLMRTKSIDFTAR